MKLVTKLFCLCLFLGIVGCRPSMDATWKKSGYTPRHFNKLAVITISKSLEARQSVENEVMHEIAKDNASIQTISGLELFPPNKTIKDLSAEEIEETIKQSGADGVLTISVVDSYTSQSMVDDGPMYSPYYYGVGPYIYNTWDYIYSMPQYETNQNYIVEANLYDLNVESTGDKGDYLVWKGQDDIEDPGSISSAADSYAKNLVDYMDGKGLLQ